MANKGTIVSVHTPSFAVGTIINAASKRLDSAMPITSGSASQFESAQAVANIVAQANDRFVGVSKLKNDLHERIAKSFVNSEPEILFTCDYIVDDKLAGCLLVWEKFFDSTHYEVFKVNLFKEGSEFERILFLDVKSLEEERQNFIDYLTNTIGLDVDPDNIYVILDTIVKEDRVYQYKVAASRVPKNASEVEYDVALEGKNKVRKIPVDPNSQNNVFDFAGNLLGSKDLAWVICLMNTSLTFFGRASSQSISSLVVGENVQEIMIPTKPNEVLSIVNESISLFGVVPTLGKILDQCNGLPQEYKDVFLKSVDETKITFSYDQFREGIKSISPIFGLVLEVAQSKVPGTTLDALAKLSVVLPTNTGSESILSLDGMTKVLNFVNEIYVSVLYAGEKDALEKIKNISSAQKTVESNYGLTPSTKTAANTTQIHLSSSLSTTVDNVKKVASVAGSSLAPKSAIKISSIKVH